MNRWNDEQDKKMEIKMKMKRKRWKEFFSKKLKFPAKNSTAQFNVLMLIIMFFVWKNFNTVKPNWAIHDY